MPDKQLIHSASDVTSALLYALDSGLHIRSDEPQLKPEPRMLTRGETAKADRGVFFLFRPEWVYGAFQILPISGGFNSGKYIVSPGVNHSPIVLHFNGERTDAGQRRLGSGSLSFKRDWLEMPAKIIRETSPEVELWFKRIFKHLSSGASVKGGRRNYYICRGVAADPRAAEYLPPFDFIPWKK